MQSDAKRWHATRTFHRIGYRRRSYHQTGRGNYPVAMAPLNRLIDFRRRPKVIGSDNEIFQAWPRLARRNWKNSTPSRSRRFIICGLASISATIDAIFDGRK